MKQPSKTAGILSILSGVVGLLLAVLILANLQYSYLRTIVQAIGIAELVLGLVAVVGGLLALNRKVWGLALVGAIAGVVNFFPTGIAAIVFLAIGRRSYRPVVAAA